MKLIVQYSHSQLQQAVNFVAENNIYFKNNHKEIERRILELIYQLAECPSLDKLSTMGCCVIASNLILEDMDNDNSILEVDILVDPSLGILMNVDDYIDFTVEIDKEKIK